MGHFENGNLEEHLGILCFSAIVKATPQGAQGVMWYWGLKTELPYRHLKHLKPGPSR